MKSQLDHIWQRIEQEKIKPLPRWILISRQVGIWGGFTVSVVFGALTLSYLVFIMESMNAEELLTSAPLELISFAPLAWGVTFILFLLLAFWSVEHTESGYKVHFSLWILGNVAVTSVFAFALIALEVPRNLEPGINSVLPSFSATNVEQQLWHRPDETGRIQGEILTIDEDELTLETPRGEQWHVLFMRDTRRPNNLEAPMNVRIIGDIEGKSVKAKVIVPVPRPFKRPPMRENKPPRMEIRGMIP